MTTNAEPIAEPDRLGPLAAPQPAPAVIPSFADGASVRALLLAALREAVEPARAARARGQADAVHDVRKALRRTRSLLDLVGEVLPRRERKDIHAALVEARHNLGPARDLAVAGKALTKVATAEHVLPAAAAIVAAAKADAPTVASISDELGRAADVALAQADAIAAALPDEVDARAVIRGVAETYRRARRARRKARSSDVALHRWRRRSKELLYQLELFTDVAAAAELRDGLAKLDDQLGDVVDRMMLADFVGLYGHAAGVEAVTQLLGQVHDELEDGRAAARKDSKDLFAVRPRKLRKQLRRGLAPAAAEPSDG